MNKSFKYLLPLVISFSLIILKVDAQNLNETEKTVSTHDILDEVHLNKEVKEFVIKQIRKTELVKPIDNHEFVHFFLDRFDGNYKTLIKNKFDKIQKKTLTLSEIKSKINELVIAFADDFNQYKLINPNTPKDYNNGVNMRHFDIFDLGNRGAKRGGANDKGPGQPCNNPDFETGDATGWDLTEGNVNNTAYAYVGVIPATLAGAQHAIMAGGNDPVIGAALPMVNPTGGAFSLRLGDGTGTGSRAAGASQTFLVDPNSEAFTYSYALVLEDPSGHSTGEKPFFKVNMYDQAGASITCGDFQVISGPVNSGGDPDFVAYGGGPTGYYLPWRTTFAPLQAYVGQNVTIEFIIGDCSQSGHYGYGYIDASCEPLQIIPSQTVICGGNPVTLTAPAGAASYLWSPGGQTTQTITTNVPGNYSVDVIPVTGPACALTLTATIGGSPDFPVAEFNAVPSTVCVGTPITFNNTSYVVGPSAIDSVEWDFDSNGTVDDVNFNTSFTYATPGNYTVTLTVYNNGCTHDTTVNVTITPGTTAIFSAPTVCQGVATNFTDASVPNGTVVNWDWDFDNDAIVDNSTQNPSYTFPSSGTFPVNLAVSGVGGTCPHDTTINVIVNPSSTANFSSTTVCVGSATNFTDISGGGVDTWDWDFNNDAIVDNSTQNPSYTFPLAGTFPVNLTVSVGGLCPHDTTISVTVINNPVANFSSDIACENALTTFTDLSTPAVGLTNWNWDFNNDGVIDDINQNPTNTFPGSGVFPVSLSVSAGACSHDTIINVTVSPNPTAAFTFTNVCFGTTTGFTDLSNPNGGTITNWDWDFDNNGTVDNSTQNPTNGFSAAGTYTVELLVTTALGCVDSITMPVVVNPIPEAGFTVADVCFGATSVFTDTSIVQTGNINTWAWDFGDLSSTNDTSSLQNPTYTYLASGTYNVTLAVISDSGCINNIIIPLDVFPEPIAAFATNDVCANLAANFIDQSLGNGGVITNWDWDFDNNGTVDNTNQNPSNNYPAAGAYNVQLIVSTGSGCADTIVQPITIFPMPVANYSFVNTCFGAALAFTDLSNVSTGIIASWQWNFGNGNNSILQNPSENYLNEGVYNTQLIVTTDNGCEDTLSQQVEVWPLPVVNFTPTEVCLNDTTFFIDLSTVSNINTANNITNWSWDFNGLGGSNLQNPAFVFSTEGIVPTTLILTTNNSCVDSATLNVTVNPLPVISFGLDTAACAPVCFTLNSNAVISSGIIASYQWYFGDGSGAGGPNPSYCFQNASRVATKSYDVSLIVTSDKGCVSSAFAPNMVTVYPIPYADFIVDPEITDVYNPNISFFDASQIASNWQWDFGDGNGSIINNPSNEYPDSAQSYIVSLYIENIFGCTDTVRREVIIRPAFAIWIPNVFTPDGDGVNDLFFVQGFGLKEIETLVFDRWGELVYEGYTVLDGEEITSSSDAGWDGTFRGNTITVQDVFVYKVRVKDVFNEWHDFIGRITLIK
jgi:gliding motility-associated-like protein